MDEAVERPEEGERGSRRWLHGALVGAAFGFAAGVAEVSFWAIGKIRIGTATPASGMILAVLLVVGLGLALGLLLAPARRLRRGRWIHVGLIALAWSALGLYAGLPELTLHRALALLPWGVALGLTLLVVWLTRRGRAIWVAVHAVVLAASMLTPEFLGADVEPDELTAEVPSGPDVLVVVLDTVRADHVGAYGYAPAQTPNLDRLAAEGALFEDATSPATWSLPSHASLFTGLFPATHGAHGEHHLLSAEHPTLASALSDAGYDTRCFTANAWITERLGLTRGFHWCDEAWREGSVGRTRFFAFRLLDRLGLSARDNGGGLVASNFEAWARESPRGSRPTFAFVNFIEAHFPYHQVPDEYLRRYTDRDRGELRALSLALMEAQFGGDPPAAEGNLEPATAMYDAGVSYADHLLGRLLDALEARGTLDDTIVIVLSDHGEALAEHGVWGHGKSIYEEETRVPLLVRHPSKVRAGVRVSEPVSTVGVFGTVMDLLDRPAPDSLQVTSLRSEIEGGPPSGPVIAERFTGHGGGASRDDPLIGSDDRLRSYRSGDDKLVLRSDGRAWLFDLREDPGEHHDLSAERPETVARLRADLEAWRAAIGLPGLDSEAASTPAPELDEQARERLRQLGYAP